MPFPYTLMAGLSVCWIFIALPMYSPHEKTKKKTRIYIDGFLFHLHLIQRPTLHMKQNIGSLNTVQRWGKEQKGPQTSHSFSSIAPDNTHQTIKGPSFHSNSRPLSFIFKTTFIEKFIAFKLLNAALK